MGKDVIMSHIVRQIAQNIGVYQPDTAVRVAAAIFGLGQLSPVVDTTTNEVLGFEFKIVVKKHDQAVRPK